MALCPILRPREITESLFTSHMLENSPSLPPLRGSGLPLVLIIWEWVGSSRVTS